MTEDQNVNPEAPIPSEIPLATPPEPRPETEKQQTVRSQYRGFQDYLQRDLPEGEAKDLALEYLAQSFEAAFLSAEGVV